MYFISPPPPLLYRVCVRQRSQSHVPRPKALKPGLNIWRRLSYSMCNLCVPLVSWEHVACWYVLHNSGSREIDVPINVSCTQFGGLGDEPSATSRDLRALRGLKWEIVSQNHAKIAKFSHSRHMVSWACKSEGSCFRALVFEKLMWLFLFPDFQILSQFSFRA